MSDSPVAQRLLLILLACLLLAIGVVVGTGRQSSPSAAAATTTRSGFAGPTMPPNLRAANFSLRDQNGRPVSLAQYRGKVVVLTFIHSLCHGACPFMTEQIKGALANLPAADNVPAVGVSVSPWEDSPGNRRRFLAKYQMTGRLEFLSGSVAALRPIWRAYAIAPDTRTQDIHSTFVLLIDKRGFERVGFPAGALTPEDLTHDILVLEREPA